jgi:hypothetical protein
MVDQHSTREANKQPSRECGHATLQLIRESSFSFLDANRSVRIEASLSAGAVLNAYCDCHLNSALSVDAGGPAGAVSARASDSFL